MTPKRPSHGREHGRTRSGRRPEPLGEVPAFNAIKPREYGTTKAVVARAFDQAGGAKRVAAFFDLGLSQTYGFTDPEARGSDLTLDRARRLTFLEGVTSFADDMAALAGGVFLAPEKVFNGQALAKIGGDLGRNVADVVAEILTAVEDGKLDRTERAELRARTDVAISTLVALRARLMAGDIS